jgi:ankyrin repeat protein
MTDTLMIQAQQVHAYLATIHGLDAKIQAEERCLPDYLKAYAAEIFVAATVSLEKEAERLDRLLQGLPAPESGDYMMLIQQLEVLAELDLTHISRKMILENIRKNNIPFVKVLLQIKDLKIIEPSNAITTATQHGHTEIVRLLLEDGRADPSANDNNAIKHACCEGHIEIVRLLLQDPRVNPDVNYYGATTNGHVDVVRLLLEDGRADPSSQFNLAIRNASERGHTEIVRLLLQWSSGTNRVVPTMFNNSALRRACSRAHTKVVKLLLKDPRVLASIRDINDIFLEVCDTDHIEIVRLFLAIPTLQPKGALERACVRGNVDIVRLLLADPRVVNQTNAELERCLEEACQYSRTGVVELLLAITKPTNWTIQSSINTGNNDIFRLLINKYRIRDNWIIHEVLRREDQEIVRSLLEHPDCNHIACLKQAIELYTNIRQLYVPTHLRSIILIIQNYIKSKDALMTPTQRFFARLSYCSWNYRQKLVAWAPPMKPANVNDGNPP